MNTGLLGLGLGASLMYFFDGQSGRRRRARARDRIIHLQRESAAGVRRTGRDIVHRTRGVLAELRGRLTDSDADGAVLEARVRTELGHVCSHPGAIEVTVWDGQVGLRGNVLEHEADRVVRAVGRVRGVNQVIDDLVRHDSPASVPDLQGGTTRGGPRFELLQRHWSPTARLLVTAASLRVLFGGSRLLGFLRLPLGALALARSITNTELRRLLGMGGGRRAVDVNKSIRIDAPRHEVFSFFLALDNFPKFMSHVREVIELGDGRYHWEVEGPAGTTVGWDAELTRLVPNEVIAWKSLPGATVGNTGVVRFEDGGEGMTRVHIRLAYNPPAGAFGHFFAKLLRSDPKRELDEDLIRLKSILEDGVTTAHHQKVRREDLSVPPVGAEPDLGGSERGRLS